MPPDAASTHAHQSIDTERVLEDKKLVACERYQSGRKRLHTKGVNCLRCLHIGLVSPPGWPAEAKVSVQITASATRLERVATTHERVVTQLPFGAGVRRRERHQRRSEAQGLLGGHRRRRSCAAELLNLKLLIREVAPPPRDGLVGDAARARDGEYDVHSCSCMCPT